VGPHDVGVVAELPGYGYNVPGPKTAASGETIPGSIDTVRVPLQDPVFGDPSIVVAQTTDATGGVSPFLDSLGRDRGLIRNSGETDGSYRTRTRALPDAVTPAAIRRQVGAWMGHRGLSGWQFIEGWDPALAVIADAPDGLGDPGMALVLDDPRPGFQHLLLDPDHSDGAFYIVVPDTGPIYDMGLIADDPGMTAADFLTLRGQRAVGVVEDVGGPDLLGGTIRPGVADGGDTARDGFYAGLWNLIQATKAGGVSAFLIAGWAY